VHKNEEYIQWLKDTDRMKYEMTDVFTNDNGQVKVEKKMAWVARTTPNDWEEFCKDTGNKNVLVGI
jgi:hypothetical protein